MDQKEAIQVSTCKKNDKKVQYLYDSCIIGCFEKSSISFLFFPQQLTMKLIDNCTCTVFIFPLLSQISLIQNHIGIYFLEQSCSCYIVGTLSNPKVVLSYFPEWWGWAHYMRQMFFIWTLQCCWSVSKSFKNYF